MQMETSIVQQSKPNFSQMKAYLTSFKKWSKIYINSKYQLKPFKPIETIQRQVFSKDATRITPNAGGSSLVSETLSFEVLEKFFGAKLPMTEMEVFYFPMDSSINDYVVEITSFRKKHYKNHCNNNYNNH